RVSGPRDAVSSLGLLHLVPDVVADLVRVLGLDPLGLGVAEPRRLLQVDPDRLLFVLDDDLLNAALLQLLERDRGVDLVVARAAGEKRAECDRTDDHQDDPDHRASEETRTFHAVVERRSARTLL